MDKYITVQPGQGYPKNENCSKLAETRGKVKFSFSKSPYKFDIFSGHLVVSEHWYRRCNVFTCI